SERPIVVDFGISAILQRGNRPDEARLTQQGTYLGTPLYMSPEQASNGDVTEKSDIYSLGAVAFELLVGRPPFEGNSVTVGASHHESRRGHVWSRARVLCRGQHAAHAGVRAMARR